MHPQHEHGLSLWIDHAKSRMLFKRLASMKHKLNGYLSYHSTRSKIRSSTSQVAVYLFFPILALLLSACASGRPSQNSRLVDPGLVGLTPSDISSIYMMNMEQMQAEQNRKTLVEGIDNGTVNVVSFGKNFYYLNNDGSIYTSEGAYTGARFSSDGSLYDSENKYVGFRSSDGSIWDLNGHFIGRIR